MRGCAVCKSTSTSVCSCSGASKNEIASRVSQTPALCFPSRYLSFDYVERLSLQEQAARRFGCQEHVSRDLYHSDFGGSCIEGQ